MDRNKEVTAVVQHKFFIYVIFGKEPTLSFLIVLAGLVSASLSDPYLILYAFDVIMYELCVIS